jgi:hypothetical protein
VLGASPDPPDENIRTEAPRDGHCHRADPLGGSVESPVPGQVDQHPKAKSERHQTHEREWEAQVVKS